MYSIEVDATRKPCAVRLTGDLTIYHASEMRDSLMPLVAQYQDIEIDLAGIGEIDTAGVQVLMVGKREAIKVSGNVRLANHSKAVISVFDALNLSGHFGDPVVIPATT